MQIDAATRRNLEITPGAVGRARGLAAGRDRPHGDRGRGAAAGAPAVGAVARSGGDPRAAGGGARIWSTEARLARGAARRPAAGARHRPRAVAAGARPRRAARSGGDPRRAGRRPGGSPRPLADGVPAAAGRGGGGACRAMTTLVGAAGRGAGRRAAACWRATAASSPPAMTPSWTRPGSCATRGAA